jgi:hypothetical protein
MPVPASCSNPRKKTHLDSASLDPPKIIVLIRTSYVDFANIHLKIYIQYLLTIRPFISRPKVLGLGLSLGLGLGLGLDLDL